MLIAIFLMDRSALYKRHGKLKREIASLETCDLYSVSQLTYRIKDLERNIKERIKQLLEEISILQREEKELL